MTHLGPLSTPLISLSIHITMATAPADSLKTGNTMPAVSGNDAPPPTTEAGVWRALDELKAWIGSTIDQKPRLEWTEDFRLRFTSLEVALRDDRFPFLGAKGLTLPVRAILCLAIISMVGLLILLLFAKLKGHFV